MAETWLAGALGGKETKLQVGDRVRVLPNHACVTPAAYRACAVVEAGARVVAEWSRDNGW